MRRFNAMLPPDLLSDERFCKSRDEYYAAHERELAEKARTDLERFLSGADNGLGENKPNRRSTR